MKKLFAVLFVQMIFHVQSFSQTLFNQYVQLKTCKISIAANAFVATTDMELEFYNPTRFEVEGAQQFNLNRGQVITDFQLELNGKFRDGSIEERRKANTAYSTIVGKRIDPAILQMTGQDNYVLNIYPIAAYSSRKVKIRILQMMKQDEEKLSYRLPLRFAGKTDSCTIDIDVRNTGLQTAVNPGLLEKHFFMNGNSGAMLRFSDTGITLNRNIDFSILLPRGKSQVCMSNTKGNTQFWLRFSPSIEKNYFEPTRSVAVFWDISRSSTSRNINRELNFLEDYIKTNEIESVKIFLFNQQVQGTINYQPGKDNFFSIRHYLENYNYNGATQLGNLNLSAPGADVVLLFSDGVNSIGKSIPVPATVPVYSVVSGEKFELATLKKIVANTGGQIINLSKTVIAASATMPAGLAGNYLINYSSKQHVVTINEKLPVETGLPVLLSGTLSGPDTITFVYGNNHSINGKEKIYLPFNDQDCNKGLNEQLQLLRAYDSLMYNYDYKYYDWKERLVFGLHNRVITPQTSFLVLERIEDYIKYNIQPPKELEQKCAEMNYVYKNEYHIKTIKEEDETALLEPVVKNYNDKIHWWDNNAPLIDLSKQAVLPQPAYDIAATNQKTVSTESNANSQVKISAQELTTVVVTASGVLREARSLGYSTSTVRDKELTRTNPVNVQSGLAGKVSGLVVQATNSGVLPDYRITLRGIRSLTGNNQPLLVVDGNPTDIRYLSSINPNDISDVTILKSASASAIYGSEGVNGVIVITSKRRYRHNFPKWGEYKLKYMEDVEYMKEIKNSERDKLWETYKELERVSGKEPAFYLDMADYFHETGMEKLSMDILYNAAEHFNGRVGGLKAIAYVLESWKKFDDAINVYKGIIEANDNDLETKRDLALAFYQSNKYQLSLDMYYSIIIHEGPYNYDGVGGIKAAAIDEMNALIIAHKKDLNLERINLNLVRPLPVDLRVSVTGSIDINNFQVKEPGGELCNFVNHSTKSGGYFNHIDQGIFNQNTCGYSIKNAVKGKYRFTIDAYDYYHYQGSPQMVRVLIFKNFQKEDQTLEIKNIMLDNQYGRIEIAETIWK